MKSTSHTTQRALVPNRYVSILKFGRLNCITFLIISSDLALGCTHERITCTSTRTDGSITYGTIRTGPKL